MVRLEKLFEMIQKGNDRFQQVLEKVSEIYRKYGEISNGKNAQKICGNLLGHDSDEA